MIRRIFIPLVALAALASCEQPIEHQEPEFPVTITSGIFRGECVGYCYSETTINPVNIMYVEWSSDPEKFPERSHTIPITQAEWQEIVRLVDMQKIGGLDSIIGCPDCNDLGGEWIEVQSTHRTKRVVFPEQGTVEAITPFLDKVRAVRGRAKL